MRWRVEGVMGQRVEWGRGQGAELYEEEPHQVWVQRRQCPHAPPASLLECRGLPGAEVREAAVSKLLKVAALDVHLHTQHSNTLQKLLL